MLRVRVFGAFSCPNRIAGIRRQTSQPASEHMLSCRTHALAALCTKLPLKGVHLRCTFDQRVCNLFALIPARSGVWLMHLQTWRNSCSARLRSKNDRPINIVFDMICLVATKKKHSHQQSLNNYIGHCMVHLLPSMGNHIDFCWIPMGNHVAFNYPDI